ncbi:MAG TPA: carboxypeptidase-like regulatory domain-containing protein [Kofleriaceae bacterium]|nr:carboxypeptidase-like regulatory domain-containing protein [Kofleriaceae bacterium]
MRSIAALALIGLWVGCGPSTRDNTATDAEPPMSDACQGLRCKVADCTKQGRLETSISGTVFAPNGTLPLSGVTVYVPNQDPGFFTDGAQCSRCSNIIPGDPIAQTISDTSGKFTLTGVPSGTDIPVILTIGKWRRQVKVPVIDDCTATQLPSTETSLPKRKAEGEMPRIAISTGSSDALECLARKLGVADSEFTNSAGDGRVHLFASNGANKTVTGLNFEPSTTLWGSVDELKKYDLVMFSCEGSQLPGIKPQNAMDALKAYADLGGRVFLSHYHSIWISGENNNPTHAPPEWPTVATCHADVFPPNPSTGIIDQASNPRGKQFADWMVSVMASTALGQLSIREPRQTCTSLDSTKAERWVYLESGNLIQNFQFTTPIEVMKEDRCGKVVFSDMHVASGSSSSPSTPFPNGCSTGEMTPQEKALAFMFFDIATCVGPIF